jgi:hypothetical protein
MKSNCKIWRAKGVVIAIVVILAASMMIYWRTGDLGTANSSQPVHQVRVVGAGPYGNGGPRDVAKVETGGGKGMSTTSSQQPDDRAEPDSAASSAGGIQAFGINGRLTTQVIEKLNLTPDEVASLTKLLTTVKEQATADFVSRTKLTENVSGENGAFRHTYFVIARPDRGTEFSAALARGSESLIGEARAQRINSNISSLDFLGGAGKYDLNIVVSSDGGEKVVKYEIIDPQGGGIVEVQECSYNAFSDAFGDVFAY